MVAELYGRNAKKLGSPLSVIELLQSLFRKKRAFFRSFNCCFANFKSLKLLQCIICLSVSLPSDWAVALEVFYLFFELCETSQPARSKSDFIKGKAVNACTACSDPPQQLRLFESVNLSVQIYLAQRERATVNGGKQLLY